MEFRIFTEPQQGASYEDQLAVAQAAEQLGFDGFFRSDHYLAMGSGDGLPGPTDAWTTLAGLARETKRIRLGTLVSSVTFRHPGILAIQVAQVDAMSGGRAELGLGAGWFEKEHLAYAIPFPPKRFGMLEEQLEIVTSLWSNPLGSKYNFEGEHYRVVDSPGLPKPAQSKPPIIVGGAGEKKTPALAARFADEYNTTFGSFASISKRVPRVIEACDAIGRDPSTLVISTPGTTAVGATRAEAERRATAAGSTLTKLADGGFGGTVSEVTDQIGRFAELGISRFYFQIQDLHDRDHLELIAREVVPQFS
ncbi:MAG: LLM class F420-dependent oxidoreductase [Cryobacterium sp.]|nr:LLM class F420-dependent oxidoreductase [Cryobacterium sp.]MBX3089131.1 LLM class F420-dependent oxidoreductase [Cryobacterium sp.]MBX3117326.1 LLM class F420-dependent oxidoreductase [Cryobacterium sp.]MCC7128633.1 LLM class F420-dependent oxidoreductase [Microbacteriaceae bacterium]MCO5294341.1 LLM class F420-dependent oxidoreductase [Homoserinimonas sp.]